MEVRLLFLILAVACFQASSALDLEAEDGSYEGTGTLKHRSAASNEATVLLNQGGYVTLLFNIFSPCTVLVQDVAYTNDGASDDITVILDGTTVGSFQTVADSNFGHNWNVVRSSGSVGNSKDIVSGPHSLKVVATSTDQYGVEIDKVMLTLNKDCIATIECIATPSPSPAPKSCENTTTQGKVVQRSTITECAEEDNVHVPVYFKDIHSFNITATLPLYRNLTSSNNRAPDFTNCKLTSRTIWMIGNESTNSTKFSSSCSNLPSIFNVRLPPSDFCGQLNNHNLNKTIITFNASGPSEGVVEATIGSILTVQFTSVSGTLLVEAAAYGRASSWISLGTRSFNSSSLNNTWHVPDLTWKEGTNNVSLTVTGGSSTAATAFFHYIRLEMRKEMGEYEIGDIYDDGITIVKAIGKDFWWLYPQAMVVRNIQTEKQLSNVIYIRVLRKVPGIDSWPEVFVLYQDGNSRILTFPPSGIDWIPFGSSVIIGQSDPDAVRPYSAISQIDFDPSSLSFTLHYTSGGQAVIHIITDTLSTMVTVSEITYNTKTMLPFSTFRSMWVSDGNADVDHVMSENGTAHILNGTFSHLAGTNFFFFRTCISKHNTLSPDIRIEVQCPVASSSTSSSFSLTSSTTSFLPLIKPSTTSSMLYIRPSKITSLNVRQSVNPSRFPTVSPTAAAPPQITYTFVMIFSLLLTVFLSVILSC